MKVDLNAYLINKSYVQSWWLRVGRKTPESAVTVIAESIKVPCICVTFWIGEVEGWTPFVMDKIRVLIKFYGYKNILNMPEGFPKEEL